MMYSTDFLTRYAKDRMNELAREAAVARLRPNAEVWHRAPFQRRNAAPAGTVPLAERPAPKAL